MNTTNREAPRLNQQWLIEHQHLPEFINKWVLLQDGKLLCIKDRAREIFEEHPNLISYENAMITVV